MARPIPASLRRTLSIWRWQGKVRWIKALTTPPGTLRNRLTTLTSRFKVWRNPARFHCRFCPRFPGWFMPRHALVSMLAMSLVLGLASLPAASRADDIKPKAPETAFSGKLRPDILGISTESNADAARATPRDLSASPPGSNPDAPRLTLHPFKNEPTNTKPNTRKKKGGGASFFVALNLRPPPGPKQSGEMLPTRNEEHTSELQ